MKHSALKLSNNGSVTCNNNRISHTMIFKNSAKVHKGHNIQENKSDIRGPTSDNVDQLVLNVSNLVVNENTEHASVNSISVVQNGVNKQVNSDKMLLYDINGLQEDKFAHTLFSKQLCHHVSHSNVDSCVYFKKWKNKVSTTSALYHWEILSCPSL